MASLRLPRGVMVLLQRLAIIESRSSLAGGSLWEEVENIHDWEIIARYLFYDHSANRLDPGAEEEDVEKRIKRAITLDPREEAILLHILITSIVMSIDKGGELGLREAEPRHVQ